MTTHHPLCFGSVRRAVLAFAALGTASCHGGSENAQGTPDDAQIVDDSPPILVTSPTTGSDATACDEAALGGVGCSDVDGGDGGGVTCVSGSIPCAGVCVPDDVHNCGACGGACPTQANATAVCATSDAGSYACGSSCLAGFSACGGACVDLTSDVANCGACGQSCAPGTCSAGQCQPWLVAQADNTVVQMARASLATDGTNVVWLDPAEGVSEAPIIPVPNAAPIILASPMSTTISLSQVAMANGMVVWTEVDQTYGLDLWTALDGEANSGATSGLPGESGCTGVGLALNSTGTAAYFISGCGTDGNLWTCNLGQSVGCSVLGSAGTQDGSNENDVAFGSDYVFFTGEAQGTVGRYSLAGASASTIETGQGAPYLLTTDSSFVYWASGGPNITFTISRTSQANPTAPAQPVLAATGGAVTGIATDGTNLYVSGEVNDGDTRIGVVGSVPVGGGVLTNLYSGMELPLAMATAGGVVVWMDSQYKLYALRLPLP
jgi:hypothetical protein